MRRLASVVGVLLTVLLGTAQAQTVAISPTPIQRFVDSNGVALSGGKLFIYLAGTTTKATTYTDSTGATQQTNPIILNSRGEPQNNAGTSLGVWLPPYQSYKFVLAPSTDTDPPANAIWTIDNVPSGAIVSPLVIAQNNAALKLLNSTDASYFLRMSFASLGDTTPLFYRSTSSICSVGSGAGDNGWQVKLKDNNCAIAIFPKNVVDATEFGLTTSAVAGTSTPIAQAALDAAYNIPAPRVLFPIGFNFNKLATYGNLTIECGGNANPLNRKLAGPGIFVAAKPGDTYATTAVVREANLIDCTINGGGLDGTNTMWDAVTDGNFTRVNSLNTGTSAAQFDGVVTAGVLTVLSNLKTASLTGGGAGTAAGYAANDYIVLTSGTFSRAAIIQVDTVDGGGGILTWHIFDAGVYSVQTTTFTQGSTSGVGTGATFGSATWDIGRGALVIGQAVLCDGCRITGTPHYPTIAGLGTGTGGIGTYTLSYALNVNTRPMISASTWTWTDSDGAHVIPSANSTFMGSAIQLVAQTQWISGFVGGAYNSDFTGCSTTSSIGIYTDSMKSTGTISGNKFNQNRIQAIDFSCNYLGYFVANGADNEFSGSDFQYNAIGILAGTGANNADRNKFTQNYFEGGPRSTNLLMRAAVIIGANANSNVIDGIGSISYIVQPLIDNASSTIFRLGNYVEYNGTNKIFSWNPPPNYLQTPVPRLGNSGNGMWLSGDNAKNIELGVMAWGSGSIADISCGLARGTNGYPALVTTNDVLCRHGSFGQYDSRPGHLQMGGYLDFLAGSSWSSTNAETYLDIYTVKSGTTAGFKAWHLASTGGLSYPSQTDPGSGKINALDLQIQGVSLAPLAIGQTAAIGGGALGAGACASANATVTGATTSMVAMASPVANPKADATHGLSISAYVSSADTVTVDVCAIIATTPTSRVYNAWVH